MGMAPELAEIIISPLVNTMREKLGAPELRDFGSFWGVEEQLGNLSSTLDGISAMLCFVEESQIRNPLLRIYLGDLKKVILYANLMLDEFIYETLGRRLEDERNQNRARKLVRDFLSFSFNENRMLRRHEIPCVINEIRDKLAQIRESIEPHYLKVVEIEGREHELERRQRTISLLDTRQKSSSLVVDSDVVGRSEDKSLLISLLASRRYSGSKVPVVAIVGMGGLGKTTLSQIVYNDPDVKMHFELRVWVCVPNEFRVERLTNAIMESITLKPCLISLLEPNHVKLQDLVRGKKILLVLDDAWNENRSYWEALWAPFRVAAAGSRVLVTTRSQKVASVMGAVEILPLKRLSDEDCWLMFKKQVFGDENTDVHPNLEAIGRKIVRRCEGLPLAVTTLGGLLLAKLDHQEWQQVLESKMWDLEENIMPALSLSYHYLPAHLKLCFAYCSLFPKGYEFRKAILVPLWMAEGFIPSKQVERMEEIGREYFDDLFHRSFFQCLRKSIFIERDFSTKVESVFVIHEVMHDLAQSVSKGMCFRIEHDEPNYIFKRAGTASLLIRDLNKDIVKSPSSFLSVRSRSLLEDHVPYDVSERFKCLRVLDLSNSSIRCLPDSIGYSKHLRCLNLSCTRISMLPESICQLYFLQTLMLKHCSELHGLPKGMGNLINLQYLVMDNELWKSHRPAGIRRLTCLKTLPHYVVSQADDNKIGELKELQHLEGLLWILRLENVATVWEAREACLKNKRRLDQLVLEWSNGPRNLQTREDSEAILDALQPPLELESLTITWYLGLRFPDWLMRDLSSFNKLVSVKLSFCTNCKFLPPFGQLPALESLEIVGLNEVTHLTREFYIDGQASGGKNGFQKLKFLTFDLMYSWEEWYGAEDGEFPCLEELTMRKCYNLRRLPPLLPSVKVVKIEYCHSLTTFPKLPSICSIELLTFKEGISNWVNQFSSLYPVSEYSVQHSTNLSLAILRPLEERLQAVAISEDDGELQNPLTGCCLRMKSTIPTGSLTYPMLE
ncbi:putative disease resistance RPP13-like protein 1 [Macadamia integrifolia]|uniref:putative disease resistance RPP13-like protein 1 n=1 Tax=Macadamia integrifolia TaxID=60698 RepID=UPI001C4F2ADF|nr:putative disease resistance RPP13-like protein 1 [Macadamia integrifolia]